MFKKLIYVEKAIKNTGLSDSVIQKIKPAEIIYINNYKDVLNQPGSDWRVQKVTQKIILAQRKDHFYYEGSGVTPNFGYNNFYYNTLALNCIYDCQYCYLQGLLPSAHIVLFLNNHDFISQTKELLKKKQAPVYMALSYDTDLPAIEHWYPYCKEWIDFVKNEENLIVEIRTKSVNTKVFENTAPCNRVILAWTLSPQEIIQKFEPLTPPLSARIKSIKKLIEQGWQVRVCIDPILHTNNWMKNYSSMIDTLFDELQELKLHSISLGVFRMNKVFLKRIKSQRQDSSLINYPYTSGDETVTYNDAVKNELVGFIENKIKLRQKDIYVEIV